MKTNFYLFTLCLSFLHRVEGESTLVPVHVDLSYGDHKAQTLDVYLPNSDIPTPAILFVHGGGWQAGSKKDVPMFLKNAVAKGVFAIVSVGYRFTDVATHPAQAHDCLRAVQFVRFKAEDWNIDPSRIGITGGSAGGHLSMFVATYPDYADLASKDPIKKKSSRVVCAVSFAGPSDWSLLGTINHDLPAFRHLIGCPLDIAFNRIEKEKIKDVSPVTYVSPDDPPLMVIHGDADKIVPFAHAESITKRLKEAGVETELVRIKGGKHNVAKARRTKELKPVMPFLKKHLRIK